MIHLLEVSPEITVQELKKMARRFAMTGGYELALKNGLSSHELKNLSEIHILDLKNYKKGTSTYRSNNSYRILKLILSHPKTAHDTQEKISSLISDT